MSAKSCQKLKLCLCAGINSAESLALDFEIVDLLTTAKNLSEKDAQKCGIEKVIALSDEALKAVNALNSELLSFGIKVTDL